MMPKDILSHRIAAMDWEIPSAGEAVEFVTASEKLNADIDCFLVDPVTNYVDSPEDPVEVKDEIPFVHAAKIDLGVEHFGFQPKDDEDNVQFEFFVSTLEVDVTQSLSESTTDVELRMMRFGLLDPRKHPKNTYSSILDRNPDASVVTKLNVKLHANGHIDLDMLLADFSSLVIPDPFIS